MRRLPLPDQAALRELFDYDPETGWLTNRCTRNSRAVKGTRAGHLKQHGYRVVGIDGVFLGEHRVVWKWWHGTDPDVIDHVNSDSADNRIANLRSCTMAENNCFAAAKRNRLPLGVKKLPHKGYMARRSIDGARRYLGTFDTPERAHAAYLSAAKDLSDS